MANAVQGKEKVKKIAQEVVEYLKNKNLVPWQAEEVLRFAKEKINGKPIEKTERKITEDRIEARPLIIRARGLLSPPTIEELAKQLSEGTGMQGIVLDSSFDGDMFIVLKEGEKLCHITNAPIAEHR
ncbi:MAG: hypothetical protein ACK5JF_05020 [Oscillospiraceae bacterium]